MGDGALMSARDRTQGLSLAQQRRAIMVQLAELLQKEEQQEQRQHQEQQCQQQQCQQHEQQQQHLLEENRQQRLTIGDLQLENGRQQQRLRQLEEDNQRQRAASKQQQGRLHELEEENRELRVTIANQRRASTGKQQQCDGDCSVDDHSIHSLDVDAIIDSVSQEVAENSCHESETHTDAGAACSSGLDAGDSSDADSDYGEDESEVLPVAAE
ncbi:hypothetical protein JKP88DRAFT_318684 [Tribonema minus]|uniref:Uncharacterized protein n=1 Tax=Tribonema minus TaxID=303371 RepID=A0A835YVZ7_9STRA|nr:hypothetical protein JKP88DRAFT_318684 [Tribonema minus]